MPHVICITVENLLWLYIKTNKSPGKAEYAKIFDVFPHELTIIQVMKLFNQTVAQPFYRRIRVKATLISLLNLVSLKYLI